MFLAELDKELTNLKQGTRRGARLWPQKMLLRAVVETASIANSRDDFDPDWTVVVAHLVSVYRSEYAKKKAIDDYVEPSVATGPLIRDGDD